MMPFTRCLMAFLFTAWIGGCGDDPGPCTRVCEKVKPKLIEQMPDITADDVLCGKAPFTEATTCAACEQIFFDRYQVTLTENNCMGYFD
jgi:hypothetical protein